MALLRGINVGQAKRIAMADLRALVTALGFGDVQTLLNSGNVVFTASPAKARAAATRIEQAVSDELGVPSRVTVLSAPELTAIIAANPLLGIADNPSRLMVSVCASNADARRLEPLQAQSWTPDVLAVGERVAYMWYPHGSIDSALAKAVARAMGDAVTTRNWATMLKLHALLSVD